MAIETVFAHVSCRDLNTSVEWYEKLFGKAFDRRMMSTLVEWQFSASAWVQLFQSPENSGHSTLTLGVDSVEAERNRLEKAGLQPSPIKETDQHFLLLLRDPDGNQVVFATGKASSSH